MKRLLMPRLLRYAIAHPVACFWGVREFRWGWTRHYEFPTCEGYNWGREFAHVVTHRRWDDLGRRS